MNRSKLGFIVVVVMFIVVTTTNCEKPPLDTEKRKLDETKLLETKQEPSYFWLIVYLMIEFQVFTLSILGQPMTSLTGGVRLWSGDIHGPENSQQITDWYTITHILHGLGYYWILGFILSGTSISFRFLYALAAEIAWEIVENTPVVIKRYRKTALAIGYSGDSILNSVSDTFAMIFGFYLSSILPTSTMIAFAISAELFCVYMIRDNLTLNLIQLIYPLDAISKWQANV